MSISFAKLIRRNALVSFFVLAYAICTVTFELYVAYPELHLEPLKWIGIFSPTISAVTMAALIGGLPEIKRLLAGFTRWKIGWRWYLAVSILLLVPLTLGLIYVALGNPPSGLALGMTSGSFVGALLYTIM